MFEIDLRASAARAAEAAAPESAAMEAASRLLPVVGVVAAVVGALWLATWRLDRSVAERREAVVALDASVNASRQQLAEISGKQRALSNSRRPDLYWSDELRLLSEKLPDKLWLMQVKSFTVTREGRPTTSGIAVEGGALSSSSEGNLDLIGKFIQDLQSDPRFQETFAGVSLESVKRSSGDPYTLVFTLTLPFKS